MMTPTAAAYVAGIVDGEGSISLIRSFAQRTGGRYVYAILRVANTDQRLVDWLHDTSNVPWRASRTYKSAMNERCKPVHHLVWAVSQAQGLIGDILPFLVVKREQAELALRLQELTKQATDVAGGKLGHGRPIPEWLVSERQAAYARCLYLNRRGAQHESVV